MNKEQYVEQVGITLEQTEHQVAGNTLYRRVNRKDEKCIAILRPEKLSVSAINSDAQVNSEWLRAKKSEMVTEKTKRDLYQRNYKRRLQDAECAFRDEQMEVVRAAMTLPKFPTHPKSDDYKKPIPQDLIDAFQSPASGQGERHEAVRKFIELARPGEAAHMSEWWATDKLRSGETYVDEAAYQAAIVEHGVQTKLVETELVSAFAHPTQSCTVADVLHYQVRAQNMQWTTNGTDLFEVIPLEYSDELGRVICAVFKDNVPTGTMTLGAADTLSGVQRDGYRLHIDTGSIRMSIRAEQAGKSAWTITLSPKGDRRRGVDIELRWGVIKEEQIRRIITSVTIEPQVSMRVSSFYGDMDETIQLVNLLTIAQGIARRWQEAQETSVTVEVS